MGTHSKKDGLTSTQRAFVAELLANGLNATRAYKATHPRCTSDQAARVEGSRTLALPHVAAAIAQRQAARWQRLQMDGDEAMALIALSARADILDAYGPAPATAGEAANDDLVLLPVSRWPERLRLAVKAVKADGSIVLHDALRARELVATATGRIRSKVDVAHSFDHAAMLAALTPTATVPPPEK